MNRNNKGFRILTVMSAVDGVIPGINIILFVFCYCLFIYLESTAQFNAYLLHVIILYWFYNTAYNAT